MKARVTVLSENSVTTPSGLIGEHGFAALVERGEEKVLLDTGRGVALFHNAPLLGLDLSKVQKVVLSHGHSDHTGGLLRLLETAGPKEIIAHPGVFASRSWFDPAGPPVPIGCPFPRERLEGLGARFVLEAGPFGVAGGISTTGEVPRVTLFETGDSSLRKAEGGLPDPHEDDLSLVVEGEKGLAVLLGCAHAGVVNILRRVRELHPGEPIALVLGGTHLGFSSEAQMAGTAAQLKALGIPRVGASHCTGLAGACRLRAALGDKVFFFAGVGTMVEI